ncbi:MAG: hypothetical protein II114_03515 [Treponema sp.]|nr:hypothetical protein [Treponema sp.]
MKPVKFFSMAFAVLFSFGSAFALPSVFNSKLSAAEKTSLENGQPVIRKLKSVKDFSITSTNSKIVEAQDTVKAIKPAYLAEIIQVMPYAGNENLPEKLSAMIMDVSSYAGIPYWSDQWKQYFDLYSSAQIKSSAVSGGVQTVKADLVMEPFGTINTTITSRKSSDSYYYVSTNDNKLKYSGITCVDPGKMKSIIVIVRDGNSWILYGIGAVNAPDVFFLRDRIETSFMNRIKTFCSYFFKKL